MNTIQTNLCAKQSFPNYYQFSFYNTLVLDVLVAVAFKILMSVIFFAPDYLGPGPLICLQF